MVRNPPRASTLPLAVVVAALALACLAPGARAAEPDSLVVRAPDSLATRGRLDVFVMSRCPYARRFEKAYFEALERDSSLASLRLVVHYIFSRIDSAGRISYRAMHGPAEESENLVQMLLRDGFPRAYPRYLRLRAESDAGWQALARIAGVPEPAIGAIEREAGDEREALERREFDEVRRWGRIVVQSPTIVREGVRVSAARLLHLPESADSGHCGG